MSLLLFDIDLTLINSGGAGRQSMALAFEKIFGMKNGLDQVNFAGRTDALIFKDGLEHQGLEWTHEAQERFKKYYLKNLETEIKKPNPRKHVEPGVLDLLMLLSEHPGFTLGLLTGNWRQGARIKLDHFDLLHFFELGAFGDDSEFRDKLPPVAAQRFEQKFSKKIEPNEVYVIGDTPLDVACARPFGAKSVAVATGFYSVAELKDADPDFVFTDLSDHDAFLRIFDEST